MSDASIATSAAGKATSAAGKATSANNRKVFYHIINNNENLRRVIKLIRNAPEGTAVVMVGESGSGKDHFVNELGGDFNVVGADKTIKYALDTSGTVLGPREGHSGAKAMLATLPPDARIVVNNTNPPKELKMGGEQSWLKAINAFVAKSGGNIHIVHIAYDIESLRSQHDSSFVDATIIALKIQENTQILHDESVKYLRDIKDGKATLPDGSESWQFDAWRGRQFCLHTPGMMERLTLLSLRGTHAVPIGTHASQLRASMCCFMDVFLLFSVPAV